ncbi:MAG TPA: hypothetical protein VNH45_02675 [Gaiellaceae bacterium]|nr:hypothetical protein [Gaiellaceae bacterium]
MAAAVSFETIGLVMLQTRPEALRAGERIYVDDEVTGAGVSDVPPVVAS